MDLNYKWKQIAKKGQPATGHIDVYELENKPKAVTITRYLTNFDDVKQRVLFTLILEGDKDNWTEGIIANIFQDAETRVLTSEYFKSNNHNTLRHMDYQIFSVKSLEDFDYFNYGNFGFIEPEQK